MMIMMGASQSFFLTRRNCPEFFDETHACAALELIPEGIGIRPGRRSVYPVTFHVALFHQQRVTTEQAGDKGHGRNDEEENHAQHDGADNLPQQQTQSEPESIQWREHRGNEQGACAKQHSDHRERRAPGRRAHPPGVAGGEKENEREEPAELSVRWQLRLDGFAYAVHAAESIFYLSDLYSDTAPVDGGHPRPRPEPHGRAGICGNRRWP